MCNNICTKSITYIYTSIHTYMQQKWSTYTRAYECMCVVESRACGTEANMHDTPHYEALAEAVAPAATCHIACWQLRRQLLTIWHAPKQLPRAWQLVKLVCQLGKIKFNSLEFCSTEFESDAGKEFICGACKNMSGNRLTNVSLAVRHTSCKGQNTCSCSYVLRNMLICILIHTYT